MVWPPLSRPTGGLGLCARSQHSARQTAAAAAATGGFKGGQGGHAPQDARGDKVSPEQI